MMYYETVKPNRFLKSGRGTVRSSIGEWEEEREKAKAPEVIVRG
jgi:hypothetical protein